MRFRDRSDAGRQLGRLLAEHDLGACVVLALPRGGVPVAFEVAAALDAPLDVFVARKVGAPGQAELGIGAIAEGGTVVVNRQATGALGLDDDELRRRADAERAELDRRVARYRGDRPLPEVEGQTVVLVDDGLATGVTAEAALRALRERRPRWLVLAVPACAPASAARLRAVADDVVCLTDPPAFRAVGQFYERFDQTTDEEVVALLDDALDRRT